MNWDILVLTGASRLPFGIRVSHAFVSSVYRGDDAFVVSIAISINASAVIPIIPIIPVIPVVSIAGTWSIIIA